MNTIMSIQIIPKTKTDAIPFVDAAIQLIEDSGLKYHVNPLDTTVEGDMDSCLKLIKSMNELMIEKGSDYVITQVKFLYSEQFTMDNLTEKHNG